MKLVAQKGSVLLEACISLTIHTVLVIGILHIGWHSLQHRLSEHNLALQARTQIVERRTGNWSYAQSYQPSKKILRLRY